MTDTIQDQIRPHDLTPDDGSVMISAGKLREAADRIDQLEAALRSVTNNTGCCESCQCFRRAQNKARKALGDDC